MVFVSMSDGRFTTSYMPQCVVNEYLKKEAGTRDNYSYRMFLQRNANKVMGFNAKNAQAVKPVCDCPRCVLISKKNFFNTRHDDKVKKLYSSDKKAKKFHGQFKTPW